MGIKELDVLVHPFYQKLGPQRMRKWKARISEISKRPDHFLAIQVPSEWIFSRYGAKSEWRTFSAFAEKKMGPNRLIVVQDKLSPGLNPHPDIVTFGAMARKIIEIGYDPEKLRFHVYGEHGDGCVLTAVETLLPALIRKSRIRKASRIILELSTLPGRMLTRRYIRANCYPTVHEYVREIFRIAKRNDPRLMVRSLPASFRGSASARE
ncbi:MAG: hypothetical protein ABH863_02765 [Candidatus Micrarchaeota archaeon]